MTAQCATHAVLHCPIALDIPTVSTVYLETHTVIHINTWLKADSGVQTAVDNKLDREQRISKWTPIMVAAKRHYEAPMQSNAPLGQVPTDLQEFNQEGVGAMEVPDNAPSCPKFIQTVKDTAK